MRRLAGLLLATALAGCAPLTVHAPSPDQATPTYVQRAERDWTRSQIAAVGIEVHATLWDAELVASALARGDSGTSSSAWRARYLERTAFTVVVELEDREPFVDPAALLDAAAWNFSLGVRPGEPTRDPTEVEVLLIDRFPTLSGAHHHRIAMVVFFEGSLHATLEQRPEDAPVVLNVRPTLPATTAQGLTQRRSMLGKHLVEHGFTMRWKVEQG